jgi:hypothetical protein
MIYYINIGIWEFTVKPLRDRLLQATDEISAEAAPPRLAEAQRILRKAIRRVETSRIPEQTSAAALLAEALPRIIACYGPAQTASLLIDLARNIGANGDPSPLQ